MAPNPPQGETTIELIRSTDEEKQEQLDRLRDFHARHAQSRDEALARLERAALLGNDTFDELMRASETLSLGQISNALYEVGGQYRRSM
jgi:methylmalonyl-CoA mutase